MLTGVGRDGFVEEVVPAQRVGVKAGLGLGNRRAFGAGWRSWHRGGVWKDA